MAPQRQNQPTEEHKCFIEADTHSFVVKIWLEQPPNTSDRETGGAPLRGQITHVASGQRYYFERLRDLLAVVQPYLESLHHKLPLHWRIYLWMNR